MATSVARTHAKYCVLHIYPHFLARSNLVLRSVGYVGPSKKDRGSVTSRVGIKHLFSRTLFIMGGDP